MQLELLNLSASPQSKLYGVGGWLTFFCFSLTIVAPITHLNIAVKAFKNLMAPAHLAQGTLIRLSAVFAIYVGLAIFSCICGYLLWSENPRGPAVTKAYLVIGAVSVIVLNVAVVLAGVKVDLFVVVLQRLVYTVCWYAYLSTSERVRLTYSVAESISPVASPSSPATA